MKSPTQKMFVDEVEKKTKPRAKKVEKIETSEHDVVLGSSDANILKLPSKGKLWYADSVEYREIMVGDEETLALSSNDTYARTLNSVIKSVLNGCEFYEDMTVYDRDFALVWLWANNYSPIKEVNVTCRACKHKDNHKVDLTSVPVKDIKDNTPKFLTLPLKKGSLKEVNIRLNTVQDELNVENYMVSKPKSNFNMLMLVSSIDTGFDMSLDKKLEWVRDNVTGAELGIVRNFHKHFKYGITDTIEHTCSKCKEVTIGPLPFQAEDILYPTVSTDFEELLRSM